AETLAAEERDRESERPRDLSRFLDAVRAGDEGALASSFATPDGTLRAEHGIKALWTSIYLDGRPLRWANGASTSVGWVDDDASIGSPQSGVPGGGLTELANAVALWHANPSSSIGYTFAGAGGNTVTVHLDNVSQFGGTGIPCSLGVIG